MKPENILITGASGQVGYELTAYLNRCGFNAVGLSRSQLDITDIDSLGQAIKTHDPQIIINPAAYTNVDGAETDIDMACKVNRDGPENLAVLCKNHNVPLIHISTDYVFDGSKTTPYNESDTPNPIGEYAKSKYEGEIAVGKNMNDYLILRISWVFGIYGKNYVKSVLNWAKTKDRLNIVDDQIGSPTYVSHLCGAIAFLLKKYFNEKTLKWGLYHYCGLPTVTRYNFTKIIVEEGLKWGFLEKAPELTPVPSTFFPTPAKRPQNSSMDCSLIWETFGIYQKEWREGVRHVIGILNDVK